MTVVRALPVLLLLISGPVCSGEVLHVTVDNTGNIYNTDIHIQVNADPDAMYRILTDHDRLHRVSNMLSNSHAYTHEPGSTARKLEFSLCILFYCKKFTLAEEIVITGPGLVTTRVIPAQGDFKSGHCEWRITPHNTDRSRIRFTSQLEPSFWIPPFIGPVVLRQVLRRESTRSIRALEKMSAAST